jgi:hypothetical protein
LGWLTGEIVKASGRVMIKEKVPVPGDIFEWAALWSALPLADSLAA